MARPEEVIGLSHACAPGHRREYGEPAPWVRASASGQPGRAPWQCLHFRPLPQMQGGRCGRAGSPPVRKPASVQLVPQERVHRPPAGAAGHRRLRRLQKRPGLVRRGDGCLAEADPAVVGWHRGLVRARNPLRSLPQLQSATAGDCRFLATWDYSCPAYLAELPWQACCIAVNVT